MLYLVNQKGKVEEFRSSKIAQTITKIYTQAVGVEKTYLFRKQISQYTQKVLQKLPSDGETTREKIALYIEEVLQEAPLSVHEHYLEYTSEKKKKKNYVPGYVVENIDPVLIRQNFTYIKDGNLEICGNKEYPLSVWIKTFQTFLPNANIDWEWLKKISWQVGRGDDHYWVSYWLKNLSVIWSKSLDAYKLASYIKIRYEVAKVMKKTWLDGTVLSDVNGVQPLWTEDDYKIAFVENANKLALKRDWHYLSKFINPDRDYLLGLKGYEVLRYSLQKLGNIEEINIYEAPQWLWMRTAAALSVDNEEIVKIYYLMSTFKFIPAEGFMREAGKAEPDYFEDSAVKVQDNLESIYNAIKETLVSTKWTGNISVDWSEVRGKDAPIAGGLRKSGGVIAYWKMINHALESQGRLDCPATMILPIWHLDILHFLNKPEDLPYIKVGIKVPDYFMNALRKSEYFYLFDSSDAHNLMQVQTTEEYEKNYKNLVKNLPSRHNKISSEKLWEKILQASETGKIRLIYSDNVQTHQEKDWLAGINGVGILPGTNLNWATGVINLQEFVDKDQIINIKSLQESLELVLKMYKNFTQHEVLCLGVVGFWEFLKNQKNWEEQAAWLAEAWYVALQKADHGHKKYFYNPFNSLKKLHSNRNAERLFYFKPLNTEKSIEERSGSSLLVKTVWAPFQRLADLAEVSVGGLTFNSNSNLIVDKLELPSPVFNKMSPKTFQDWTNLLKAASAVNPWIDQGIALSLPKDLQRSEITELLMQAWYQGLPCVILN